MKDKREIAKEALDRWNEAARSVADSHKTDSILRDINNKWEMASQQETMYWLFSTAAQVVAAFVGLLIMCVIFRQGQSTNSISSKRHAHWAATISIIIASIAIGYDFYMIYRVPSELINQCTFFIFCILNIFPILLASYSVWAYLKG